MAFPRLFICAGATKAGTSWLHRALSDHPETAMTSLKELHYFDMIARDEWDYWIADAERRYRNHVDASVTDNPGRRARQLAIADDLAAWLDVIGRRGRDDAAYLAFVERHAEPRHKLVGDMTPAYALLDRGWLEQIAALPREVRFVYVLRDPVERLWSHCRMIAGRRAADETEIPQRANNILRRTLQGQEAEIALRSDYAGPLSRLREIAGETLLVLWYEELFTEATAARLHDFLGLSHRAVDFGTRVLEGPDVGLDDELHRAARDWLAPQYDYCRDTFARLPDGWDARQMEVMRP